LPTSLVFDADAFLSKPAVSLASPWRPEVPGRMDACARSSLSRLAPHNITLNESEFHDDIACFYHRMPHRARRVAAGGIGDRRLSHNTHQ
jgi:hypothetical protein